MFILRKLRGVEGFPKLIEKGTIPDTDLSFIIMEMLGHNLKQLMKLKMKHRFSVKTVV